jgi:lambda family phage portal protein
MAKPSPQPSAHANWVDRIVAQFAPHAALRRLQARSALAYYEAAQPSRLRKFRRDQSGPNALAERGAVALRTQMRYLERNHDITRGSLDVLVNNTVGPNGIGIEFQPRKLDGTIHDDYAAQLAEAHEDWQRHPEVTHAHDWQACQRLIGRTYYRDGEEFNQQLIGPVAGLDHGTRVPYSLEMIEADLVPFDFNDESRGIVQGIERNEWGRVRAVWVYRRHPGERFQLPTPGDLKRIPMERMIQVAELGRIGQLRGITRYASVINRIEDIKDYEESERVAAKIAAMLTAYIKRQAPQDEAGVRPTDVDGNPIPREITLGAGTVVDTLGIGEEIGLIDTSRPNVNLVHFRNGQLRAFAAGICASYSSVSRNYDGTYSAQRQELVESFVHYAAATDDFVGKLVRPVTENFITAAHLSGVVKKPVDLKPGSEFDVQYLAPSMPWIDPAKEANAWLALCKAGFASEVEVIRKRGQRPEALLEQVDSWRKRCADKGLVFDSNAGAQLLLKDQIAHEDATPDDRAQARAMLAAMQQGVLALAQREGVVIHNHVPVAPAPESVPAPQVTVEHHTHIENKVEPAQPAAVHIDNHIQAAAPAQVVVQPAAQPAYRQVFTRDEAGEIAEILNTPEPIPGAAH